MFSVTQPIPPRADSVCSVRSSLVDKLPGQDKLLHRLLQLEAEILAEISFHYSCESMETPKRPVNLGKLTDIHRAKHCP